MEEDGKLPLKRVELSLSKFNDVAVPHHLELLRQHRANILKFEEQGSYSRVRAEQTHARRVTSQLRALLRELEGLRAQVRREDLGKFDDRTRRARDRTLAALVDYLETSPLSINRKTEEPAVSGSALSTDSVGVVAHAQHGLERAPHESEQHELEQHEPEPEQLHDEHERVVQLQLQLEQEEAALRSRAAVLHGWTELQADVRELHAAWATLHAAAREQAEATAAAETSVNIAAENVVQGRANLAAAERLRAGAYGLGGAALGCALGGPLGLVLGAKAAAGAALGGSLLGYVGARLLGRRRQEQLDSAPPPPPGDKHKAE